MLNYCVPIMFKHREAQILKLGTPLSAAPLIVFARCLDLMSRSDIHLSMANKGFQGIDR